MAGEAPQVEVRSRAELRRWLEANHASSGSVWLVTWKTPSPHHLPYGDIVEEALCFGWIDSQPRRLDDERAMIRLSPRNPRSGWSAVNKRRLEGLLAAGLVAPAGLAAIAEAKRNGTWTLLDAAHAGQLPADLLAAFAKYPGGEEQFAAFPPSARKAILEWIGLAKRPETRAARIAETARLAAKGERANQWRK